MGQGQVVTFYSYKGGVGRTMALANVAVLLARWGYKTLIVDWDLEAPGLEHFFKDYLDLDAAAQTRGVVDLLHSVSGEGGSSPRTLDWQNLLITVKIPEAKQPLHLLTAGARGDGYFGRVRGFDIETFYAEKGGGIFIENLRDAWKGKYDFVLLDSRTGVTDIGGICTIQLPDLLVLLFTATRQGLDGVVDIARKALEKRQQLPVDRLRLISVPLPCRFDSQVEFRISQDWLDRFTEKLSDIYAEWLPKKDNDDKRRRALLEATKIPYIPYFSFGEKLAVLEQGTTDPSGLGYAYETLAAMIANNLESVEQILDNRAEFVRTASHSESAAPRVEPADEPVTTSTFKRDWVEAHHDWLESDGRKGKRLGLARALLKGINLASDDLRKADFTDADLSGALLTRANLCGAVLTGANLREAVLAECNLKEANLQNAALASADLSYAQLNDANLTDADLREATLSEAVLADARLSRSKLTEADFYRATLRRVSFDGCDIRRASFREADLQDADLGEPEGMIVTQLAGANLTGAKLHKPASLEESVAEVNGKAWFHRLTYAALLIVCGYLVWAGIEYFSAALSYRYSVSSGAETMALSALRSGSLKTFGLIPAALFVGFFLFQFSLQSVWVSLNALPDVFPDGKTLDRKIAPGFVSNIVRLYLRQKGDAPPSYRFQGRVDVLLLWFAVPMTLSLMFAEAWYITWNVYFELPVYALILFLFSFVSLVSGFIFWRAARRTLRRDSSAKKQARP